MTVGKLIRERRKARGWSQEKLAARLEMQQTYLSRLERDEVGLPQRATLEKLGAALGITLPEFYRAAGVLEGIEEVEDDGASLPPPVPLARDSDRLSVAEMVRQVEAWPGEQARQRREANKARMPREAYEQWCIDLYRMWEGNLQMVLDLTDRMA